MRKGIQYARLVLAAPFRLVSSVVGTAVVVGTVLVVGATLIVGGVLLVPCMAVQRVGWWIAPEMTRMGMRARWNGLVQRIGMRARSLDPQIAG